MRCPFCKADLSKLFARIGRKGGSVSTPAKAAAARENAKKGGWPKGKPRKPVTD